MKTTKILISLCLAIFLAGANMNAQVKIGGAAGDTPYDQAILELESAAKGLRLPQLTTAQRNALVTTNATKAKGLMIFNTETGCIETYNGAWFALCDNTVKVTDCTKIKAFTIDGDGGSMVDGAIVTYKIDPTTNPSATYTWTVTGANNVFIGSTTGTEVSVKWKSAGVLTAKPYGCTTSATVSVTGIQACTPTAVPTFKYQAKNPYKNGTYTYEVNPKAGATDYTWTVTNGTILEGQGTTRIRVLFGTAGVASVKVKVVLGDCQLNEVASAVTTVIDDKADYTTITNGGNQAYTTNPTTYASTYTDKGTITDADGNTYTVKEYYKWGWDATNSRYYKADRQIWMIQNLSTYVSGAKLNMGGAKAGGSANENNGYEPTGKVSTLPIPQKDSAKVYGFMYTWNMIMDGAEGNNPKMDPSSSKVRGICPSGWTVPSDRDWTNLEWLLSRTDLSPQYIPGGTGVSAIDYQMWTTIWETGEVTGLRNPDVNSTNTSSNGIGTGMKLGRRYIGANGAAPPTVITYDANNNIAFTQRNSTEFNLVLAGFPEFGLTYASFGKGDILWTSSIRDNNGWYRLFYYTNNGIVRESRNINSYQHHLRCMKKL